VRCIIALAPAFLCTLCAQTKMTIVPVDSAISGVAMFGPDEPSFEAYIGSRITPEQSAAFQAILPYSVVLQNTSAQPILGYLVQFSIVGSDGRPFFMGQIGGYVEGQTALAPNAAKWIAVDGIYSSILNLPNTPTFARFMAGKIPMHQERPPSYYNSAQSVSVSLDSVLLVDGTLSGPDHQGMASKFTLSLQGDIAIAQAILGFKNDPAGLQQYLDVQGGLNPDGDLAKREMGRRARMTAATLKRKGLDAALAEASDLYNTATTLHVHKGN
jgi:hypothetical protein